MTTYTVADVMATPLTPHYIPSNMDLSGSYNSSDLYNMTSEQASLGPNMTQATDEDRWGALKQYPQFLVAHAINTYCLRIITAIGFPGNILSFITILRMKPASHPAIYVAVLAISDNCCLAAKLLLIEVTRHDVNVGAAGCKLLFFVGNATAIYANWLLVLMTVERFMAIWFPLKVSAFCTRRRAAIAMSCLVLMVIALCAAFLEVATHKWVGTDFQCGYKDEYLDFVNFILYWMDALFYALIPCVLLIIFNGLIILGIRRAASIQRQLTEDSSSRYKSMSGPAVEKIRQQRQITIMLLMMCVTFIILILPNCCFFVYKPYWKYSAQTEDHANYMLTEQITFMLSDFSHAVNFFVYFFSTKKFRDRFIDTICCCRNWRRRIQRNSHVGQSQFSETGSVYFTSSTNGGVIPLGLRSNGRY